MAERKAKGKSSRSHKDRYHQDTYPGTSTDTAGYSTDPVYGQDPASAYSNDPYAGYYNSASAGNPQSYSGYQLEPHLEALSVGSRHGATQNPAGGSYAKNPADNPPARPPAQDQDPLWGFHRPQDPYWGHKTQEGANYKLGSSDNYYQNPASSASRVPRHSTALPLISQSSAGQSYGSPSSYEQQTEAVRATDLADSCEKIINPEGDSVSKVNVKVWEEGKSSKRGLSDKVLFLDAGSDANWVSKSVVKKLGADTSKYRGNTEYKDINGDVISAEKKVRLTFRKDDNKSRTYEFLVCPADSPPFDILLGSYDCYNDGIIGAPDWTVGASIGSLTSNEEAARQKAYGGEAATSQQGREETKQSSSSKGKERDRGKDSHRDKDSDRDRDRDRGREERKERDRYRDEDTGRGKKEHRRK